MRSLPAIKPASIKAAKPKEAEVTMARELVEEMSSPWDPQYFTIRIAKT